MTGYGRTYHRTRTPAGVAVSVRRDGSDIPADVDYLLAVGPGGRLRCGGDAAVLLVTVLADLLGLTVTGAPDWAGTADITVSER